MHHTSWLNPTKSCGIHLGTIRYAGKGEAQKYIMKPRAYDFILIAPEGRRIGRWFFVAHTVMKISPNSPNQYCTF
jgi:hypothetical protein